MTRKGYGLASFSTEPTGGVRAVWSDARRYREVALDLLTEAPGLDSVDA